MRPGFLLVTVTAAIAFVAGCGSSSSAGSSSTSASTTTISPNAHNGIETRSGAQIVAAAVAATKQQSSFHFVETAGEGSNGVVVVGDVGTSSGEQHVTIREGKKNGHVTLILSGKTAFFQGDALGLEGFTGLSAKLSTQYADKWISVPSSNTSFSTIAGTLEVGTAATQFVKLPGTLTRGETSTQSGHAAVAVNAAEKTSTGSLTLTIYVATMGEALPILVAGTTTATGTGSRSISAKFSGWGEPLHVITPSTSVPIAEVQALAG
jgi:hypothetical protein